MGPGWGAPEQAALLVCVIPPSPGLELAPSTRVHRVGLRQGLGGRRPAPDQGWMSAAVRMWGRVCPALSAPSSSPGIVQSLISMRWPQSWLRCVLLAVTYPADPCSWPGGERGLQWTHKMVCEGEEGDGCLQLQDKTAGGSLLRRTLLHPSVSGWLGEFSSEVLERARNSFIPQFGLRQQMKQRWKPRLGVIFLLGKT